MKKPTGETITDEQIRQGVVDGVLDHEQEFHAAWRTRQVGESTTEYKRAKRVARERCAALLNARNGASS